MFTRGLARRRLAVSCPKCKHCANGGELRERCSQDRESASVCEAAEYQHKEKLLNINTQRTFLCYTLCLVAPLLVHFSHRARPAPYSFSSHDCLPAVCSSV